MIKIIQSTLIVAGMALVFSACEKKKNNPTPQPQPGTVRLEMNNVVGSEHVQLNGKSYTNAHGDSYTVTTLKYYISNIRLTGADGASYTQAESYHLVDESKPASAEISLASVPAGKYNSITFTIGVDSIRNVSGAQTGALDPNNDMFWGWITGYIMAKMEGTSPQSTAGGNALTFHIGGFSGANNTVKTVTMSLPETMDINNNSYHIHLNADLAKWFSGVNTINFATLNAIHMPGASAKQVADNYANMFSIEAVEKE